MNFNPKPRRLVRDRFAHWLASRYSYTTGIRRLEGGEKLEALLDRLEEELARLRSTSESEAIAEMIELLNAISTEVGSNPQEIELIRQHMHRHWGGYEEGTFLYYTKPPEDSRVARIFRLLTPGARSW